MAIKRYLADADNTITNAFQENLTVRATGSNMGSSDILEVFSIQGQVSGSSGLSSELSRILIQFPVSDIISDRSAGNIPASGSVSFFLKLYNAEHTRTTPKEYNLTISQVSASWQEGVGMDMESYKDKTFDYRGSNWIRSSGSTAWTSQGGDYHASPTTNIAINKGTENIEVDVSEFVEQWIRGAAGSTPASDPVGKQNYGFGIKLSDDDEANSKSFYTKKFFGRGTQFFHKKPIIEARWDSARRDNRGDFYLSSSIVTEGDNLNKLYLYNYIRGSLRDIAGDNTAVPTMKLYYGSGSVPEGTARGFLNSSNTSVGSLAATRLSTGIYYTQFAVTKSAVTSTYPYLIDVWEYDSNEIFTGSAILPKTHRPLTANLTNDHIVTISNLKKSYGRDETARFRLYVREKNWSPNIYNKAVSTPENTMISTASYEICRELDNFKVIPYGTGSSMHTVLSHDVSGNYFDVDMSLFQAGYSYKIKFAFYDDGVSDYVEQPYEFKFRVREDVY